jgi:hypothetical protein
LSATLNLANLWTKLLALAPAMGGSMAPETLHSKSYVIDGLPA